MARSRNSQEVKDMVDSEEDRIDLNKLLPYTREQLIPTGSTVLNLALSGDPYGGFRIGTINNIIGDSAAGKTFLLWTIFAEMCYLERFDNYDLNYDEPEASLEFPISSLFGSKVEDRVLVEPVSETVEEFHDNLMARLAPKSEKDEEPAVDEDGEPIKKRGKKKPKTVKPFAWGLDSLDSICTEDEEDRDVRKGTFGGQKPKLVSEILRKINGKIKQTDSILFVISQTRDAIGVTFGSKKTRSGGKALKFFSSHEMWLAIENHVTRKKIDVGVNVVVRVSKNKLTGRQRTIKFPIYYDYGIDDVTSCIDFLIDQDVWAEKDGVLRTKGAFTSDEKTNRNKVISIIEDGRKDELISLVTKAWKNREDSAATKDRKPKYETVD